MPAILRDGLAWAGAFALLAGIVFGLFVVVAMPFELVPKHAAESWPARPWRITESYVDAERGSRGRYYRPVICGVYADSPQRVCATRIRYGGFRFGEGRRQAEEAVARYPEGREVLLYFDPDDPRTTVIEARSPWTEMLTLLALALAFLMLPLLLWRFRRQAPPLAPPARLRPEPKPEHRRR